MVSGVYVSEFQLENLEHGPITTRTNDQILVCEVAAGSWLRVNEARTEQELEVQRTTEVILLNFYETRY